jgi:hypothetical protein
VDQALDIAAGLRLSHAGPVEIALDLARNSTVRRLFFRSPEDGQPSVGEIDALVRRRRARRLEQLRSAGRLGVPFLPRSALDEAFSDFLDDPARAFVLLGGSGQGKTSWAAHLFESPPAGFSCDLVAGEEIAPGDGSIVRTFARLISAGPMGGIAPECVEQAVWTWLDADNRILVVDGLDRIRSDVAPGMPQWIASALDLSRDASVRVVLISRREAWASLAAGPTIDSHGIFHLGDLAPAGLRQPSLELLELSPEEAEALYELYGVSPSAHSGRPLPTPALIETFARLSRERTASDVVSRADVLAADLVSMRKELAAESAIGPAGAVITMARLGRLLLDSADGWLPVDHPEAPDPAALNHLLRRDRLLGEGERLRMVSDDLAELLMARQLTLARAVAELDSGRKDALFVGAVAMLVAEQEAPGGAQGCLSGLLADAAPGRTPHLEAVSRAILELRAPEDVRASMRATVALWNLPNFILFASNLGELIDRVRLPAVDRFDLMMPLLRFEEADDWRDKYWGVAPPPGRHVTPFASAATRAVQEAPEALLPELGSMMTSGDVLEVSVGRALLREVSVAAPELALGYAWKLRAAQGEAFDLVSAHVPGNAAAFLASVSIDGDDQRAEVVRLIEQVGEHVFARPEQSSSAAAVADAARSLAERVVEPELFVRLAIVALRRSEDAALRSRLLENWTLVRDWNFWDAIEAIGRDGREKVLELLDGRAQGRDTAWLLGRIGGLPGDLANDGTIHEALGRFAGKGEQEAAAAAEALELLLYRLPAPAPPAIETLADALAQSSSALARSMLTFYAGSKAQPASGKAELARRDRLLNLLVRNAQPDNVDQLVRKLIESAGERSEPALRLCRLAMRCGLETTLEPAALYGCLLPEAGIMADCLEQAIASPPDWLDVAVARALLDALGSR